MKKQLLMLPLLAASVLSLSLGVSANALHPDVPLLDKLGNKVIDSMEPMSTMTTCGQCHDTSYIEAHSDHSDAGANMLGQGEIQHNWQAGPGYYGGWDPIRYPDNKLNSDGSLDVQAWLNQNGQRHIGGGPVRSVIEMDCLICHSDIDNKRAETTARGDYAWANTARLSSIDAVEFDEGQWSWNIDKFQNTGALNDGLLAIHKPNDKNCGQCHGQVENSLAEPLTINKDAQQRNITEKTGQIFSPQKIAASGLNISGKEQLSHAFDVHSDRVLGCVDCHYSLNNPVYFRQRENSRPDHLEFDPRRLTNADYLTRPLHQFAKGKSTHGLAATNSENSLRRCSSCHNATAVHNWLPSKEQHFESLACESCHTPKLYGPTLQTVDWTMLNLQGEPIKQYRNVKGDPTLSNSLIHGYKPVLLPRTNVDGKQKLAPYNLITSWFWLNGEPAKPVTQAQLKTALFSGGQYHSDLLAVLDQNKDGQLTGDERLLNTKAKLNAVKARLTASGLNKVSLASEVTPFAINHNVVNGKWATKDCESCHNDDSLIATDFTLSNYLPGGELPTASNRSDVMLNGNISANQTGGASFKPELNSNGFYIFGLDAGFAWPSGTIFADIASSMALVDILGLLMFIGVSLGVAGHSVARYIANKRRPHVEPKLERVYMYDVYERLWHWLQAATITLLIITGLVIHNPALFAIFSFKYMVQVHNVLGFILLINAALSLFYHVATGEIKQYLPEPKGLINEMIAQSLYYMKGIFMGAPHPSEKSREQKLNPLQQITYAGILNVLLPAQILTGLMIWGIGYMPEVSAMIGGLTILGPVHTLLAWVFATFIVMHVYLTTTAGHTPTAGIMAMIDGWDDLEIHDAQPSTKKKHQEDNNHE